MREYENLINKCLDLYEKASKDGVIEGIANSLWWLMFFGFITTFLSPQMMEMARLFQKNEITFKEFLQFESFVSCF